jgi:hypothetical protein
MRAMTRVCIALAVFSLCAFGWLVPGSAQVPAFPGEAGPLVPTDAAPFQSRLDRLAEEYRLKPVASGHVFSGFNGEIFLFRLGEGSDCVKQGTCVYVLFRNAQDDFPFVAFCNPGLFAMAHNHTADGKALSIFEFVCEQNTKFQIRLSPDSVRIQSYVTLD